MPKGLFSFILFLISLSQTLHQHLSNHQDTWERWWSLSSQWPVEQWQTCVQVLIIMPLAFSKISHQFSFFTKSPKIISRHKNGRELKVSPGVSTWSVSRPRGHFEPRGQGAEIASASAGTSPLPTAPQYV